MKKGYWIGRVDVANPEAYQAYVDSNGPVFARFGGRFLVRGGPFRAVEGPSRSRNIVLEFPSVEAAQACWDSADYQAVKAKRDGHATAEIIVIEGTEV
ncbi:DUF1330 domain-containing protein [Microvirga antarctica]|uniref:DUF1330 domain-containing protein n=1 Tax=Microvirga antarctica TaxID=2819233 RepID=UPI001B311B9E|nr:DUF1330 domain-containing protein [Microvirga antarctica]